MRRSTLYQRISLGLALAIACLGWSASPAQEPAAKTETKPTPKAEAKPEGAKPKSEKPEKNPEKAGVKPSVKKPAGPAPNFTPEREAAALAFANQHHVELVNLLAALKDRNRNEYERAIGELWRTSERLAASREKDPERHALELADWKLNSRIQLLAARLSMAESAAVIDELKAAIKEQTAVRIKVLELDRDRAATRAKKLDEQIQTANSALDTEVERRMDMLLKGVTRTRQKTAERNAARTAEKKAAESKAAESKTAESKAGVKPIEKKTDESINAVVTPKVAPK